MRDTVKCMRIWSLAHSNGGLSALLTETECGRREKEQRRRRLNSGFCGKDSEFKENNGRAGGN